MNNRVYNDKVNVDDKNIKAFFNNRAKKFAAGEVNCIFRKNRALAPHERSAVPLGTDHCPVG